MAEGTTDIFFEDLETKPDDWAVRSVFADWCEDNGQPELAECLRWMVRMRKRPYHGQDRWFTWFNADKISKGMGDQESDVPEPVYLKLEGGKESANHKTFGSLREAEAA